MNVFPGNGDLRRQGSSWFHSICQTQRFFPGFVVLIKIIKEFYVVYAYIHGHISVYIHVAYAHIQNDRDKIRISNLNFDEIAVKQVGLLVNGKPFLLTSHFAPTFFLKKKCRGIRGTFQSTSKIVDVENAEVASLSTWKILRWTEVEPQNESTMKPHESSTKKKLDFEKKTRPEKRFTGFNQQKKQATEENSLLEQINFPLPC